MLKASGCIRFRRLLHFLSLVPLMAVLRSLSLFSFCSFAAAESCYCCCCCCHRRRSFFLFPVFFIRLTELHSFSFIERTHTHCRSTHFSFLCQLLDSFCVTPRFLSFFSFCFHALIVCLLQCFGF